VCVTGERGVMFVYARDGAEGLWPARGVIGDAR